MNLENKTIEARVHAFLQFSTRYITLKKKGHRSKAL